MLVSVEEMSPPFLTAEKNVREKLKRLTKSSTALMDCITRKRRAGGMLASTTTTTRITTTTSTNVVLLAMVLIEVKSLTKLLSQPMKMKDGTIGAPIFVLATCAAEGLDSHTVRDVFERLIRYGAWRVALDEHGTYPSGENDARPSHFCARVYAPHVLKQAVVDNVDHDKKYDSLDGKAVVAVSTVKEENPRGS